MTVFHTLPATVHVVVNDRVWNGVWCKIRGQRSLYPHQTADNGGWFMLLFLVFNVRPIRLNG